MYNTVVHMQLFMQILWLCINFKLVNIVHEPKIIKSIELTWLTLTATNFIMLNLEVCMYMYMATMYCTWYDKVTWALTREWALAGETTVLLVQ